jgi:hypothetical protein
MILKQKFNKGNQQWKKNRGDEPIQVIIKYIHGNVTRILPM